jgi:hypothetical protein
MFALSRCGEDGIWWHADTADTMAWAHGEQGTEAHRGMQWYSVIIQWHSVAVRSTQKHSVALSGTRTCKSSWGGKLSSSPLIQRA